jgi:hypothetical protein
VTRVVQREEPPYQYVIVEGIVVDVASPTPLEVRNAIAIRCLGEEGGRAFVAGMGDTASVLFTVRPDRWITADYSATTRAPAAWLTTPQRCDVLSAQPARPVLQFVASPELRCQRIRPAV